MPAPLLNPTSFPVGRQSISLPEISGQKKYFRKIVVKANEELPPNVGDLTGSIAITRDTKHTGWLHVVIFCSQKVRALAHKIFSNNQYITDANLSHGFVVLGKNPSSEKKGHLIIAHALFDGIHTSSRDYAKDKEVSEFIIYQPLNPELGKLIAKHATQTAVNPVEAKHAKGKYPIKQAKFSLGDMMMSFFAKMRSTPTKRTRKLTAYAVADLLMGAQLRDRRGKPKAYFCTAYAMTVFQGSLLINSLSESERHTLASKSRKELATLIYKRLSKKMKTTPYPKPIGKAARHG